MSSMPQEEEDKIHYFNFKHFFNKEKEGKEKSRSLKAKLLENEFQWDDLSRENIQLLQSCL